MKLLESWKDSLTLCKPGSIKLFFLVTLKTMYQVLRILCRPWVLVPIVGLVLVSTLVGGLKGFVFGMNALFGVSTLFFIVAARPSMGTKDVVYFKNNMLRAIILVVISIILWVVLTTPFSFLPISLPVFDGPLMTTLFKFLFFYIGTFFIFSILFYLDHRDGIFAAYKRAFLMMWYNLPLFIVYFGIVFFLYTSIADLITFLLPAGDVLQDATISAVTTSIIIASLVANIWRFVGELFINCLMVNVYIKRTHDQSQLYVDNGSQSEE